jgi:uncharacterized integral membrane protein
MSTNPEVQVQRSRRGGRGYGRYIVWGVVAVLVLIFVFSNRVPWKFSFWFIHITLKAWLVLVITLLIGFAVGFVLSTILWRRRRRERRRQAG